MINEIAESGKASPPCGAELRYGMNVLNIEFIVLRKPILQEELLFDKVEQLSHSIERLVES